MNAFALIIQVQALASGVVLNRELDPVTLWAVLEALKLIAVRVEPSVSEFNQARAQDIVLELEKRCMDAKGSLTPEQLSALADTAMERPAPPERIAELLMVFG